MPRRKTTGTRTRVASSKERGITKIRSADPGTPGSSSEEASVSKAPRKLIVAVITLVVVASAASFGRYLLIGAGSSTAASRVAPPHSNPLHASASNGAGAGGAFGAASATTITTNGAPVAAESSGSAAAPSAPGDGAPAQASSPANGGALPRVPVSAIVPQIVRTATIDLRVGKNTLNSALTNIATLAATDGGYVESSSMGGGTARTSPVSGSIVIHVLDADFSDAMATLADYGKVTNQQIQGKDVTNQVSSNAATIEILQSEVTLLQGKLSQATDINTFLQIQNQLFPVEQQLQQLQNQQTVLENSAALATITTNLSAPGAPLVSAPVKAPAANSATVAWRYLRHNSLAVLDGLAVGGGWALPVLVLLAVVWLAGTRIVRRRRQVISPASP
jgi:hypothetical protein